MAKIEKAWKRKMDKQHGKAILAEKKLQNEKVLQEKKESVLKIEKAWQLKIAKA